jgi:phosphatidylinositol-3-phosphatase
MTKLISLAMGLAAVSSMGMTDCGGGHGHPDGSTGDDAAMGSDSGNGSDSGMGSDGSTNHDVTIFTIVLENHDYAEIIGSANAPYINSLIAQGALATNYKDTLHPSLPNYLYMISGDNQYPGFIDLDPTFFPFPVDQPNLGTQLQAAGIKWRSYQESMGSPCALAGSGNYAPKHNPFLYFKDMQSGPCAATNVDYNQFAADLATDTYRYMWITPNLVSDGHDPSTDPVAALAASDAWMSREVPKILASDAYKQHGGILFITWDEAEGRNGDDPDKIPMIIVSNKVKHAGMTSATAYTHGSYLATVEDLLGLQRLAKVATTPNMMEFLNP